MLLQQYDKIFNNADRFFVYQVHLLNIKKNNISIYTQVHCLILIIEAGLKIDSIIYLINGFCKISF